MAAPAFPSREAPWCPASRRALYPPPGISGQEAPNGIPRCPLRFVCTPRSCVPRNSPETRRPTASAKTPRSAAGIPAPLFRFRREKEYRGPSRETAFFARIRRAPADLTLRLRNHGREAHPQGCAGRCGRPARKARAAFRAHRCLARIVPVFVAVPRRPAARVRTRELEDLACFSRVVCPDRVRGGRRPSLNLERVFPSLLIPDPDGFLNPGQEYLTV